MGFAGRWLIAFSVTKHMYSSFSFSFSYRCCDVMSAVLFFVLPADKIIIITTTYIYKSPFLIALYNYQRLQLQNAQAQTTH